MSSLTINATRTRANKLIPRLDGCAKRIPDNATVQSQILMYAAFLTDLEAGRLDAEDVNNLTNLNLITQFCDEVDKAYPAPTSTMQ
jgi:hypothetical protein